MPCLLLFQCFSVLCIDLFQPSATFLIETSHLFSYEKQMTGFYMKYNGLKLLKRCRILESIRIVSIEPTKLSFTLKFLSYLGSTKVATRRCCEDYVRKVLESWQKTLTESFLVKGLYQRCFLWIFQKTFFEKRLGKAVSSSRKEMIIIMGDWRRIHPLTKTLSSLPSIKFYLPPMTHSGIPAFFVMFIM